MLEYFKRGLESKYHTIRIIGLSCNSSKMLGYCNRFSFIKIPSPENHEMFNFLKEVTQKEKVKLEDNVLNRIVSDSNRDINKLMIILENKILNPKYIYKDEISEKIKAIIKLMLSKNPNNTLVIRENLYNLSSSNIEVTVIVKLLLNELLKLKISGEMKFNIISKIAEFDRNICKSYKEIIHLESLIINLMYYLSINL